MNQTWENGEKPSFGTNFGPFGPNFFFHGFYLYNMLDIVASYHCMQCQGKLWTKLEKIAKDLVLVEIWATKFFRQKFGSVSD